MKSQRDSDTLGGIEGLPLQLMIIILVATMGAAILVGWMGSIETPQTISGVDVDPEFVTENDGTIQDTIVITVTDQDGNYLTDAAVKLSGLGVRSSAEGMGATVYDLTDENGQVEFTGLTVSGEGIIHIEVTKSGYTGNTSATITVFR